MKRIKYNKKDLWHFYVLPLVLLPAVTCYPTGKPDLEAQPDARDEKHFPNGTVMGKYTYMDNDGNPVQVKYYADDSSYGVELKSIKVVDSTDEPLPTSLQFNQDIQNGLSVANIQDIQNKDYNNVIKSIEPEAKMPSDIIPSNFPDTGYKYNKDSEPYDFLNKETSKVNRYKVEKANPDYEIYYQNELKGPKRCNKEKVRVYFDKENTNIRSAANNFEADKFCEQF